METSRMAIPAYSEQNSSFCVYTKKDWDKRFSKETYRQFVKKTSCDAAEIRKVKRHTLKCLIAFNQPDKAICAHLGRIKEKSPARLSSSFGTDGLTALHLATMKGRSTIVAELLKAGANPNVRDHFGWTALHHAAIKSEEVFRLLIEEGADKDARTGQGGTAADLRRFTGLTPAHPEEILFEEEDGQVTHLSIEEFESKTSLSQYSDELLFRGQMVKALWNPEIDKHPDVPNPSLKEKLQQHLASPQSLAIRVNRTLRRTFGAGASKCFELITLEEVEKGEVIGEYTGILGDRPSKDHDLADQIRGRAPTSSYALYNIDAEEAGNLTRFCNDGLPNAKIISFKDDRYPVTRRVLVAIRHIERGAKILWDYGCSDAPLKWGYYIIQDKEKVRDAYRPLQTSGAIEEWAEIFQTDMMLEFVRTQGPRAQIRPEYAEHLRRHQLAEHLFK